MRRIVEEIHNINVENISINTTPSNKIIETVGFKHWRTRVYLGEMDKRNINTNTGVDDEKLDAATGHSG